MSPTSTPHSRLPAVVAEDDYAALDGVALAKLIRSKDVSATEVAQAARARIEKLNPILNAVVALAPPSAAPGASEGLLAGVPTLIKDVADVEGLPTGYGSAAMGARVASKESAYVQSLRQAGLVLLGKSTTSELALLGTTETQAHGATKNPWSPAHSAGGSSGGAVAAVASRMVPVAHASDGGGSIRGPAAFTGVFGFMPSGGLVHDNGVPNDAPLGFMLREHCVSRSVRDSVAWLEATCLPGKREIFSAAATAPPQLRVGLYLKDSFGQDAADDVREAVVNAARAVEAAGHAVVEVPGPVFDATDSSAAFHLLGGAMVDGLFRQLKAAMGPAFDPGAFEPFTRSLAAQAAGRPQEAFAQARSALARAANAISDAFHGVDVLMCPTVPFTAPQLGDYSPDQPFDKLVAFTNRVAGYTAAASLAGWCAMSVPMAWSPSNGLPVGVHFSAPAGAEARLLQLAFQLEQQVPWL